MKKMNKKMRWTVLGMAAALLLTGCTKSNGGQGGEAEEAIIKIGATQIMDHPSLNIAREGFEERLRELGVQYIVDYQNAGGDVSTSQVITEKFVTNQYDLIYAISTPSAQAAQNAAKGKGIPVVFTAVTDAVGAGLVDENSSSDYVTGVLDATSDQNVRELIEKAVSLRNEKNAISVIYNTGEANSIAQVEQLKRVGKDLNLEVVEVGISTLTDIDQALEVAAGKADALFLISDNLLASSMDLVAQKANDKKLITVTPISAFVESGALLSIGIDYKQLGAEAADMAKQILVDKKAVSEIPVAESANLQKHLNKTTAEKLGLDLGEIQMEGAIILE